jgi:hypothetical protein
MPKTAPEFQLPVPATSRSALHGSHGSQTHCERG